MSLFDLNAYCALKKNIGCMWLMKPTMDRVGFSMNLSHHAASGEKKDVMHGMVYHLGQKTSCWTAGC